MSSTSDPEAQIDCDYSGYRSDRGSPAMLDRNKYDRQFRGPVPVAILISIILPFMIASWGRHT
jgi:hypothetical protein